MKEIADAIDSIGFESGRLAKIALLKKHADLPGFKEVLQFIFNPFIHTGIGAAKLNKLPSHDDPKSVSWQQALQYFTCNTTGREMDVRAAKDFIDSQGYPPAKLLARAIVTKNLKIGVTETTLNSVYGDAFIPVLGIMRGQHYKDIKNPKGPFIVTEKWDGQRRILVKENGKVTMYTRSGHLDEGLVDIEREAQYLPDNTVYDGELLAIGEFKNALELRQATSSLASIKGNKTGLTFNAFDMMGVKSYKTGKSAAVATIRKLILAATLGDLDSTALLCGSKLGAELYVRKCYIDKELEYIKNTPVLGIAETWEEILSFAQPIWDRHFEGVMLNQVDGLYEVSNSPRPQLLKVKANEEHVLKVIGLYEGKEDKGFQGTMGGVYLDYKGNSVGCGSGFSVKQRNDFWANPELIVGKMVEIEDFGESTNKNGGISLNCPIFKRIEGTE